MSVELCNNKKNNGIIRSGLVISEQRVNVWPAVYWKVIMNSTSLEAR